MALLWYLGLEEMLLWCMVASVVHELGHAAAAACMGVRIRRLRVTAVGAEMVLRPTQMLSYPQELAIALSGPAANLLTGILAARIPGSGQAVFVGSSVMLGVFNLLPLAPLDGGQAAKAALSLLISPEAGMLTVRLLTAVGTVLLLGAGAWMFVRTGYNISLLGVGVWILAGSLCGRFGQSALAKLLFVR